MPEVSSDGVRISYETYGEGEPLVLLHGWATDRSWWHDAGFVEALRADYRLINIDLRGHGASDKPHDPASYRFDAMAADVFAVADAEGLDGFMIWGLSRGGWVAWSVAAAAPKRVRAIITTGAWDPRPDAEPSTEIDEWAKALQRGGTTELLEVLKAQTGDAFDREFPPFARPVLLKSDPEALFAARAPEIWTDGITDGELTTFPVPAFLIAGEFEDADDDAATIASTIPTGQRLRLPGLGHGAACAASALTVPAARSFLDNTVT